MTLTNGAKGRQVYVLQDLLRHVSTMIQIWGWSNGLSVLSSNVGGLCTYVSILYSFCMFWGHQCKVVLTLCTDWFTLWKSRCYYYTAIQRYVGRGGGCREPEQPSTYVFRSGLQPQSGASTYMVNQVLQNMHLPSFGPILSRSPASIWIFIYAIVKDSPGWCH